MQEPPKNIVSDATTIRITPSQQMAQLLGRILKERHLPPSALDDLVGINQQYRSNWMNSSLSVYRFGDATIKQLRGELELSDSEYSELTQANDQLIPALIDTEKPQKIYSTLQQFAYNTLKGQGKMSKQATINSQTIQESTMQCLPNAPHGLKSALVTGDLSLEQRDYLIDQLKLTTPKKQETLDKAVAMSERDEEAIKAMNQSDRTL